MINLNSDSESEPEEEEEEEPQPTTTTLAVAKPKTGSEWAQCDACHKWRRLPRSVDAASLPDVWYCSMSTDTERNTCEAPEERLQYGTGTAYGNVEHEDRAVLPTEFEGVQLVMSENSATGYRGVFLENSSSKLSEQLPFRVEYGGGRNGEIVSKDKGNRKTRHFTTAPEAAAWYARNVHPLIVEAQAQRAAVQAQREEERAEREAAKEAERAQKLQEKHAKETERREKAAARSAASKKRARPDEEEEEQEGEISSPSSTALVPRSPLPPPPASGMAAVRACLSQLRLSEYADVLDELGYDDLPFLKTRSHEWLMKVALEELHMKHGHASKFATLLPQAAGAILDAEARYYRELEAASAAAAAAPATPPPPPPSASTLATAQAKPEITILKHHVYGGAKEGSLHSVWVRLSHADGHTTPRGGVEASAPLLETPAGRQALLAYVQTEKGRRVAKYLPAGVVAAEAAARRGA